jgi:hypothetical protein
MQDIYISEFNARYNVARSIENPVALQRRLDRIASDLLASALAERLPHLGNSDDSAYVFIEQMDVNLTLDTSVSDDRTLASTWARSLYEGILQTLSQNSAVIVFRDRSAFIASFLEDLIQDRAGNFWYYAEFDDLRSMSIGQAVLNLLTQDGDVGRDALLELTRRDSLDRLLTRLTDAEVGSIATQCLMPPSPRVMSDRVWLEALRNLLTRTPALLQGTPAHGLIRIYCNLLRYRPELGPDVNLARFIWELLDLRQTVQQMANRAAFLDRLGADNWSVALSYLERGTGRQLLTHLQRELTGTEVVGLLEDLQVDAPAMPTQRIRTAFGGIFLLVGAIADLDLYSFLQTCPYPDDRDIPKANLLLWLMALQCLGQGNLEQARCDRGVLRFAGLAQAPAPESLTEYAAQLTAEMHETFERDLQAHCQRVIRQPDLFAYQRLSIPPEPSEWLSLHPAPDSPVLDEAWDNGIRMMSAIALQGFAVRLGAMAGSPPYLSRNFLESEAEIWVSEGSIEVHFWTCPLQMVLKMAGFEHFRWQIPWLENRQLILNFDG